MLSGMLAKNIVMEETLKKSIFKKTHHDYSKKGIGFLIIRYHRDIKFADHSIEIEMGRSGARYELGIRGKTIFPAIARYLKYTFREKKDPRKPLGDWKLDDHTYWNLNQAWISLLFDMVREYELSDRPYESSVPYMDQDIKVWAAYCERMAV